MSLFKKLLVPASLLIVAILAYQVGMGIGKQKCEFTVDSEMCKRVLENDDMQLLPACNSGICPKYQSWDVDGDYLSESIVYQPMAMTKGAAQVWIIDNDEVVYKSLVGAQFSYKPNEEGTGITVRYVKEFDYSGLTPKTWSEDKIIYQDGKYINITESSCSNFIEEDSRNNVRQQSKETAQIDFTTEPDAKKYSTVITKAVESGPNLAGHYTLAHWGCGTDCFGYAVINNESGEIIGYNGANANYHLGKFNIDSDYFVLNPVSSGQERKYFIVKEMGGVEFIELGCIEISSEDMFGKPE